MSGSIKLQASEFDSDAQEEMRHLPIPIPDKDTKASAAMDERSPVEKTTSQEDIDKQCRQSTNFGTQCPVGSNQTHKPRDYDPSSFE